MSATETPAAMEPGHDHHPSPSQYVRIALILGVLTALEFSTYVYDFGSLGVPLLIVLIMIKFVLVASWFMHLKFDNRLYKTLMYGGLGAALTLYSIAVVVILFLGSDRI